MTLESPPFCPHCGEPLSPNVGYCPRCGKDVFTEPATTGAPPETTDVEDIGEISEIGEAVETEPAPEQTRHRRRTALIAVATVAALAVGGTAWTALQGDGDNDAYWSERLAQPAAVATTPGLAWTWEAGDEVNQVLTEGPTTYVVTRGGVTAVDADGEAAWTTDLPGGSWIQMPAGQRDYLLAMAFEGDVLLALDADDGSELWTSDLGDYYDAVGDHVIVLDGDTIRSLDARTGREEWATKATLRGVGLGPDAAYVAEDDHLRRLDIDTGKVDWSRDLGWTITSNAFGGITVADGFVVASGRDSVRALDSDSGAERWTADADLPPGYEGPSAGLVNRSMVYVRGSEPGRVTVYDEHGPTGSLATGGENGGFFFPVHGAAGDYVFASGGGLIYGDDLDKVGTTHRHPIAISGDGLYDLVDRTLSFTPFEATEPAWEVDLSITSSDQVTAGDGHLVVASGRTVSDYR